MQDIFEDMINRFNDVTTGQFIFYYAKYGVKDKYDKVAGTGISTTIRSANEV